MPHPTDPLDADDGSWRWELTEDAWRLLVRAQSRQKGGLVPRHPVTGELREWGIRVRSACINAVRFSAINPSVDQPLPIVALSVLDESGKRYPAPLLEPLLLENLCLEAGADSPAVLSAAVEVAVEHVRRKAQTNNPFWGCLFLTPQGNLCGVPAPPFRMTLYAPRDQKAVRIRSSGDRLPD